MKYFVFETTMKPGAYKKEGFREALAGHMAFVKAQFAEGIVLFSGTKPDNSGGVRVIKIPKDCSVEDFWKPDPMAAAEMLDYRVTAFTPLDVSVGASEWF
ncbi:MAG: hypothetical protein IJD81_07980 [Oscillospiraceae bacterium]|nr:hypothetical protein [Oscillospiraceae bacterium]